MRRTTTGGHANDTEWQRSRSREREREKEVHQGNSREVRRVGVEVGEGEIAHGAGRTVGRPGRRAGGGDGATAVARRSLKCRACNDGARVPTMPGPAPAFRTSCHAQRSAAYPGPAPPSPRVTLPCPNLLPLHLRFLSGRNIINHQNYEICLLERTKRFF